MRVLFVSHSFPPSDRPLSNVGGMQRVATELHSALSHHEDVEYSSIVLRSSWQWTHLKTLPFLGKALFQIRSMVRRGEVDAVLFSSMVTASLAAILQPMFRRHGLFSAVIVHGRDVTLDVPPYQRIVPRIFDAVDAVLPVSRATGEACLERGLQRNKLHVVPNGVSMHRFHAPVSAEHARSAFLQRFRLKEAIPDHSLLLCSVGRQVKRKGFAWFIESVLPLLPDDVHYLLAGEGPEAERIRDIAGARGVGHRVHMLGRVSEQELEMLYFASDLFVMPNVPVPGDMEGFGVVMLEAGLCGLPTIASELEGITDVIEEHENGHLVRSGDAWGFSEAIMRYFHESAALESARKRAARYVEKHFSWPAVAEQYVDVMRTVTPANPVSDKALV